MSLDCSGKHLMPNSWSPAAVRDALKRAIKDVQTSPLPRALSVDKIFGPLVREIQSDQYRHMPQGLFPVSSDSLVLDLSHNYTIFTRGDLAGVTEKELNMIALFEALQRDEICEDEVMSIAKFLTTPSPAAKGYFKIHLPKHQLEDHNLSFNGQRQCHTLSMNSLTSQEDFHLTFHRPYLFETTDSRPSLPLSNSFATLSFSEDQNHSNAIPISVSRISHPTQLFSSDILIIPAEPQAPLSPIHLHGTTSDPLTLAPRSPILGVSRSQNIPSTPSPNVISSKYLGAKKQSITSSRRSNAANKENIPPMHRH